MSLDYERNRKKCRNFVRMQILTKHHAMTLRTITSFWASYLVNAIYTYYSGFALILSHTVIKLAVKIIYLVSFW